MARNVAANLLFLLILMIVLFAIFGGSGTPAMPDKFALDVDLEGVLVERATPLDPLNRLLGRGVQRETVLSDIEEVLERAASDKRVGAVVLNTDNLQYADLVQIERLAVAVNRVKSAGKPVLAMGYYFSQPQYLIASQADALYLHPLGEALLTGLASYQPYFANLLTKLDVDVHVFRVGKFKSAVEPFLRNSISPEAAAASAELLAQLWGSYRARIAANRGIEESAVEDYIANLPEALEAAYGDTGLMAVEARLVDELLTTDGFNARIAQEIGVEPDALARIDNRSYLANGGISSSSPGPGVALITAAGAITGGEAGQMSDGIVADEIIQLIQRAKDDRNVRALVLHVDSPGGEVLASEMIRNELELLQLAGKPVVVAMAGVAASGGYWISATADRIIASPNTITGSIGIFGVLPNISKALDNAGINIDGVSTHALAGGPGLTRPLSQEMSRIIQLSINQGYHRFVTLVARGRDLEPGDVEEMAQGRVWSGTQALELGLVDQLGTLQDALDAAATLAGIGDNYGVKRIDPALTPQQLLLQQLTGSASARRAGLAVMTALGFDVEALNVSRSIARQLPGANQFKLLIQGGPGKQILALCELCNLDW